MLFHIHNAIIFQAKVYAYSELDLEFKIIRVDDIEMMITIMKGPNPFKIVRHQVKCNMKFMMMMIAKPHLPML